jgi:hypothetical protein
MQEHLEMENDYASASDTPSDSAVGRTAYMRKSNKKELRDLESRRFWSEVFAHPVGRREMWDILKQASAFEERFACGPNGFPQPEATWFHAGEQALGQRLFMSWLHMDPQGVILMQQEHDSRFAKPKAPKRKQAMQ